LGLGTSTLIASPTAAGEGFLQTHEIQGILNEVAFNLQVERALEGERRTEVNL